MLRNLRKAVQAMAAPAAPAVGFGHGAFSPDDVDDARRGRPAVSLQPFIEGLGLRFSGSEQAGAFVATLPRWPDYIFNAGRGTFPGGRYGNVGHELLEIDIPSGGLAIGTLYAARSVEHGRESSADEPFAGNHIWVPSTSVHVRAPETARLPPLVIIEKSRIPMFGNPSLGDHGMPGLRMVGSDDVSADLIAAVAEVCRPWLSPRDDAYLRLRVLFGLVNLTVNGYRSDPSDLHQLVDAAEGIADGLAEMLGSASTGAFDVPGPPAGSAAPLPGQWRPWPQFVAQFAEAARVVGLHDEDVTHLMSLLPANPIPGVPWGVLFGTPAGAAQPCRVVWHNQGGRTAHSVRGGLVTPAASGASTPVGGILHQPTAMYAEVVDGAAYCWNQLRSFEGLDAPTLAQNGLTTLRALGLAAI